MSRKSRRLAPIRGHAVRVTRTDNCGRVLYGEYNHVVSEGIVTTAFTANLTESDEINVPNFAGKRRIYEPSIPELGGYGVDLTFTDVDFEMFEIITKQTLVFDAFGAVVGIEADTKIRLDGDGFALETWTGSAGGDACENPDAQGEWGYLLVPFLKGGVMGDFSVENGAISFTITGATSRPGNSWGRGPYAVELDLTGTPSPLFQPVSKTAALRTMVVSVAPPIEQTGARPVLDPSLPAVTAITATGELLEAEFTTTPAATASVYYDFGDGTWDYVAAPGAASHTYEEPGTYTVRASQNGVATVTTEVVVPFP